MDYKNLNFQLNTVVTNRNDTALAYMYIQLQNYIEWNNAEFSNNKIFNQSKSYHKMYK